MVAGGVQDPSAPAEVNPDTGLPTGRLEKQMIPVKTQAPPIKYQPWTNKRTGETIQVPEGIDPGFDSNPGKTRLANMAKMLAGKLEGAAPAVGQAALRDIMVSPDFSTVVGGDGGNNPLLEAAVRMLGQTTVDDILASVRGGK